MSIKQKGNNAVAYNKAIRIVVTTLGVIFGIGGMSHGFFETLQGNTSTNGFFINAISEANMMWEHGNEPAFTLIPNFLITGIVAMVVGLVICIWSIGFVHKKYGSLVFLLLFITLLLVGGGVAQIIFFTVAWAFATRINKNLTWWRKVLPQSIRKVFAKFWWICLIIFSILLLSALQIATFGFVPTINDPDMISKVMVYCVIGGLIFYILSFICAVASDIENREVLSE